MTDARFASVLAGEVRYLMSLRSPLAGGSPALPELPSGWPIETYPTYAGAQGAVNYLAEAGFPVENVTIVGKDPKLVERVTGRMTAKRAARGGATAGAYWGVFIGLVMLLFSPTTTTGLLLVPIGIAIGLGLGMLVGFLSFRSLGGERGFSSRSQLVADSYELVCEPHYADEARNLLAKHALKTGAL